MEERIIRLWQEGKLDINGLIKAVDKGLITADRFFLLTDKTIDNARKEKMENA